MNRNIKKIIKTDTSGAISQYIHRDTRKELAPFVLFDAVHASTNSTWGFDWHPHSGVATLTYIYGAELHHQDTSSGKGIITRGGMQWMQAGNGIWHKEYYEPYRNKVEAHQLWIQLPPKVEDEPASYIDKTSEELPIVDNKVKVIAGTYKDKSSKLNIPVDMTYLDVELHEGEEFELELPMGQTKVILFPRTGKLSIGEQEINAKELAILEENDSIIKLKANFYSQFIIASIEPSSYPVVSSRGQIHTNENSLQVAKKNILELRNKIF